ENSLALAAFADGQLIFRIRPGKTNPLADGKLLAHVTLAFQQEYGFDGELIFVTDEELRPFLSQPPRSGIEAGLPENSSPAPHVQPLQLPPAVPMAEFLPDQQLAPTRGAQVFPAGSPPAQPLEEARAQDPLPAAVQPLGLPAVEDLSPEQPRVIFEEAARSLKQAFLRPNRVMTIPGYLVRWLPYLGPVRMSMVAGLFQAYYQHMHTPARPGLAFEVSAPEMAAAAGVGAASYWRHIDDRELAWFITRCGNGTDGTAARKRWTVDPETGKPRQFANRYQFVNTVPLTPGDADDLAAFLIQAGIREDPLRALDHAMHSEPERILSFPPRRPPAGWARRDPRLGSFQELVLSISGLAPQEVRPELLERIDDLAQRLIRPNRSLVVIPQYFWRQWKPILGHAPAWMVILLRDRCYFNRKTGELRDLEPVEGGYDELASALGMETAKTLKMWLPAAGAGEDSAPAELANPYTRAIRNGLARFVRIEDARRDGRREVRSFRARVAV
ncbi:MAG TPA: hypothetical protein VF813_04515, partial [Anaerolineaceae bacterium]